MPARRRLRTAEARCGVYLLIDRSDVGLGRIHHEAGAILGSEGEITFSSFSGDQERRSQNRGSPVSDNEPRVTRQYFKVNGALEYRATVWKRKIRAPRAVIMALRRKVADRDATTGTGRPQLRLVLQQQAVQLQEIGFRIAAVASQTMTWTS